MSSATASPVSGSSETPSSSYPLTSRSVTPMGQISWRVTRLRSLEPKAPWMNTTGGRGAAGLNQRGRRSSLLEGSRLQPAAATDAPSACSTQRRSIRIRLSMCLLFFSLS